MYVLDHFQVESVLYAVVLNTIFWQRNHVSDWLGQGMVTGYSTLKDINKDK